ncbi:MAG: hypothetical protein IT292_05860 [Deltaproteobacteria bacterium]|nr:hypothetical protein [Deltaproteobacteria bacterium]
MVKKSNLLLCFFCCLLLFLSAELALRTYYTLTLKENFFSTPENQLDKLRTKKILPFRIFGTNHYDDAPFPTVIKDRYHRSFLYNKPTNTFRIVCLGGSTTENKNNYEQSSIHYPLILEHLLQAKYPNKNIEVINAGFAAYSSAHLLTLLAFDVVYWQADMAIISENINDLTTAYWPNYRTDYSNKYGSKFYAAPDYQELFSPLNVLFQYSRFYWFLKKRLPLSMPEKLSIASSSQTYSEAPLAIGQRTFTNNLQTLVHISQDAGIKVLFASQPISSQEDRFYVAQNAKPYHDTILYPPYPMFLKHHEFYNHILEQVAAKNKTYYLDQALLFSNHENYFADVVHYTDEGVHALANNYANYIIASKIIE